MNREADYSKFWSPAFDAMDDFVFLIDKEFNIVATNESFLKFQKKGKNDIVGRKCYEIMHARNTPIAECPNKRTLETKKPQSEEFYDTNIKKWLRVTTTPIFDTHKDILGSIHIAIDITEHKAADETANRLAAIVESSDDAIVGKTLDGIITSWNNGAAKIYGYTANEIVGRSVSILVPQACPNELPQIYERIKNGARVEHFQTIRIRKDGACINVSLTVSPIKDSSGKIVGASTIARDITSEKNTEEDLKKKISELERFQKITVGRELRMKELKARIIELETILNIKT